MYSHYPVSQLFILLIICNIIINGGFIMLFIFSRKARKSVSIFMINSVVVDFSFAFQMTPFCVYQLIDCSSTLGSLICMFHIFGCVFLASGSVWYELGSYDPNDDRLA